MRYGFFVVTVKMVKNRCTFAEVIAKLKRGFHFFGPPSIYEIVARIK